MAGPEDFDIRNCDHLKVDTFRQDTDYSFPSRNMSKKPLRENYAAHAVSLLEQLTQAIGHIPQSDHDQRIPLDGLKSGVVVEIETLKPTGKSTKLPVNLNFDAQDISVLRSQRNGDGTESALYFVPDEARDFSEKQN